MYDWRLNIPLQIRNQGLVGNLCLDATPSSMPLNLQACNGRGGNQFWSYSKRGEIRRDDFCVDYAGSGTEPGIRTCDGSTGSQNWAYDNKVRWCRSVVLETRCNVAS